MSNRNQHHRSYSRLNQHSKHNQRPNPNPEFNLNHDPNKHLLPYSRSNRNQHLRPYSRLNHNPNHNQHSKPNLKFNLNHNPSKHLPLYSRLKPNSTNTPNTINVQTQIQNSTSTTTPTNISYHTQGPTATNISGHISDSSTISNTINLQTKTPDHLSTTTPRNNSCHTQGPTATNISGPTATNITGHIPDSTNTPNTINLQTQIQDSTSTTTPTNISSHTPDPTPANISETPDPNTNISNHNSNSTTSPTTINIQSQTPNATPTTTNIFSHTIPTPTIISAPIPDSITIPKNISSYSPDPTPANISGPPSPPEEGKPLPRPALATEKAGSYKHGTGVVKSSVAEVPRSPISSSVPPVGRNSTLSHSRITPHSTRNTVRTLSPSKTLSTSLTSNTPGADGVNHKGNALPKPVWSKEKPVLHPAVPANNRRNLVEKHSSGHDKLTDMKEGNESILKPFALVTAKPKQERQQKTTTPAPTVNSSRFDIGENSSIFQPLPTSDIDIMGKKRFVAPHVIYKTDKKPDEPCSITSSLSYFPEEEGNDLHVTSPPRIPPSNVTVVTVEGCSSFVIIDWEKSDNETKEYDVVSTAKGPNGKEVSVVTTNQTHTAVENLKPESSYEFQVTPKNELGTGPSSDPVSFNTESADPRVSEEISGKAAIWSQFPFQPDAYSECNGRMFIKRTWYRKFVGIQLCNSLRYQIYLSDSLNGKFHNIGDLSGYGEDHCQFVDSHLDGRTGIQMPVEDLPSRPGFYRAMRQEPVSFGEIGGTTRIPYVGWYECGKSIPGKW
ncbi:target of Nesh-SH3-like [Brachionichthys hirsutus]|uniref:target of Nesh-SH3-like n=1 Tax=Brachionichthys hirsutus TaxID=412623 RepID=UPI003604AE93